MPETFPFQRLVAALLAAFALSLVMVSEAVAKTATVGPVSVEVADDFKDVSSQPPAIHQDASGITIEASPLPSEALHEFKGPAFLDYLKSLGFTDPAYVAGGLKRTGEYTFVTAEAKGAQGPESRFLLVIGGGGRAAIVTAYAPKSALADGHASRATIEAILASATVTPAPAAKP